MTPPREKGSQKRRITSQQPSLISNYFKKVDSSAEKTRPVVENPSVPPRNGDRPPAPQIPLGSSEDDDEGPVRKRPRRKTPPDSDSSRAITPEQNATERNALIALMSPNVKEFRPPPQSPRTSRYKYIPNSPDKPTENATPEELAKKKSLHEKFVQKLGRPESLARRRQSHEETPMEDAENEEEEEEQAEEVPAAAKALRGKYTRGGAKEPAPKRAGKSTTAANAKLTPLERQYVEIKKSYPDTLLLIEVGYKFRFFGEDAKVL
jgi:DNA mismatch repair protein MSH3